MSFVDELEQKLAEVSAKAEGELKDVADKVSEAFQKLVEDDGVADEVTEKVAAVLKGAADKLDVVADKVSGLFEEKQPEPAE